MVSGCCKIQPFPFKLKPPLQETVNFRYRKYLKRISSCKLITYNVLFLLKVQIVNKSFIYVHFR